MIQCHTALRIQKTKFCVCFCFEVMSGDSEKPISAAEAFSLLKESLSSDSIDGHYESCCPHVFVILGASVIL